MMHQEFERIAGYEVSESDYRTIIEPMYMATDMNKEDFIKCLDRSRFEIKKEKTAEQKALEEEINASISEYKDTIDFLKREIEMREKLLQVETDIEWIKTWESDIKRYKKDIKLYRNRITTMKWVLA